MKKDAGGRETACFYDSCSFFSSSSTYSQACITKLEKDTSAVDETEEDDTSEITEETTTDGVEENMEKESSATETEESTNTDEITETNE